MSSPFPKLSQTWRVARLAGSTFGVTALTGFAHLAWSERTALIAVAVGAVEASYRKALPSGKASGWVASLLAAYRQITSQAKAAAAAPVEVAPAEATAAPAAPAA